jgi:serine/threonine protein kinase
LSASTLNLSSEEFPAGPYTAPEVAASPHNASKASDIYSLGVILFEMLSGRQPFGNRTRNSEDQDPALKLAEGLLPSKKSGDLEALLQLILLC